MDPNKVRGPRNRIAGDVTVLHTSDKGGWSLASFRWKEHVEMRDEEAKQVFGVRWNGDVHDDSSLGHPLSAGRPVWFVLPEEIGDPLRHLSAIFSGQQ